MKKHKQRFEHKCHSYTDQDEAIEIMEDLEKEGFELVAVSIDTYHNTLFFKRPV